MVARGVYPGARYRPVSFDTGAIGAVYGWVLHVQAGNGSCHDMFDASIHTNNPRVSTFWVSRAGLVEQYQLTSQKPWAQMSGNTNYLAVETEGEPSEALTSAQVAALAALHVWLATDDRLAEHPGEHGIAWHGMGGVAWGNHPGCPGNLRKAQRSDIITLAKTLRGNSMDLTADNLHAIAIAVADMVETRYQVHVGNVLETRDQVIGEMNDTLNRIEATLTQLAVKLK